MRFLRGSATGRLVAALLVAPGIVGLPAAGSASEHPTNVELAEEAIRGAVGEALVTFPRSAAPVQVVSLGASDVNTLVESVLVEEMAARGLALEVATPDVAAALARAAPDTGAVDTAGGASAEAPPAPLGHSAPGAADAGLDSARLFYRVTDFSFRYADIYRKLLVGPRRIRRLAKVDLHLRLAPAGARTIAWSENATHSTSDVIPYGQADLLESKTFAFAKPERGGGTLARIYEPLIVTGIVGGLVLLFYSNQSGN